MTKKYIIIILVIGLLALSQWAAVTLVYAHKINGTWATTIARVYNLKAGTVTKGKEKLNIYLADYFANQNLASKFLELQYAQAQSQGNTEYKMPTEAELSNIIWDKLVKDAWLRKISQPAKIQVTKEDVRVYLTNAGDIKTLEEEAKKNFDLPFDTYKNLVVKPFILEAKVYEYLLGNYSDTEGAKRAQDAYAALESGQKFLDVLKQYSDDKNQADSSIFLQENDLVNFYEPIKKLKPGEYSTIVISPGAYIIWHLEAITNAQDKAPVWEVKAIFIKAKILDEFLADYLKDAAVNRQYKK